MLKKIYFALFSLYDWFVDLVFGWFWEGSRQRIPDLEEKHRMLVESAVALAARIRSKQLTSVELVQACIERIQVVNPLLNALIDVRFEAALKEARQVDELIRAGLPTEYFTDKPFLGVPFTAKEYHAVSGCLHTLGLVARRGVRAESDAECVRLLREAGAVCLGVTNIPELCMWQETRNMVFGQTSNPYHTGRTPGGSSGGEAALNAALGIPISLCSDIGGSTRMPGFYCGLFGLNPTAGSTSLKGSGLRSGLDPSMSSLGFVTRHAEDLLPLTTILLKDKQEFRLDREIHIKDVKIFYTESARDPRISPISSDLRKAMKKVIKKITEDATSTEQAPEPYYHRGFDQIFNIWKHGMTKEKGNPAVALTNFKGEVRLFPEIFKKLACMSNYTLAVLINLASFQLFPIQDKQWADDLTNDLKEDLIKTLGDNGVLLFPSAPAPAPYHYALLSRPCNNAYWGVFNALHCPAVQIPLGLNADGIPLGIQAVAAPKHEKLLATVAQHFEILFGGYVPPCKVDKKQI
ncbi:hypothetical protein O0L34_g10304 [Tuta absoluta]|nr:hypothetical protein O0L34_g10304 [Tuta absoluta]